MRQLLLIPHIHIQNANALSSAITIGFPAMTAWLGGVHALQRLLNEDGYPSIRFNKVAICSHAFHLHTHKGYGDYHHSIIGTANPLDKDATRPSFIEEPRCRLEVSLVVEYDGLSEPDGFIEKVATLLHSRMKLAGGDILKFGVPVLLDIEQDEDLKHLVRKLMPGYVLIERRDLMEEAMQQGQDALAALLDYLAVQHRSHEDEDGSVTWSSQRKSAGWIVPIATGFQGLTPLGQALRQRDMDKPHRFAEAVVTLGEFVMSYRITDLDDMLWQYHADLENNLYICQQNKK